MSIELFIRKSELLVGKITAAISGMGLFIAKISVGNIQWKVFLDNLIPAALTALFCGFIGAAGTRAFHIVRKLYLNYKSNKK